MSRRVRIMLAALAWALGCVAIAQADGPPQGIVRPTQEPSKPSVQLGAQLYAGNCSTCHGIAGAGITHPRPGAGDVQGQGPSLRGVGAQAPDFYLRVGFMPLAHAHEEPQNNRVWFTDTEIRSINMYVASLGKGPGIPHVNPSAGTIQEGLKLFTDHCAGCHQMVGRGGYVYGARVPPLQGFTPTEIAEAVRIGPYLMPKFSAKQISDSDLNSLVRYVESTADPDNHGGWGIGNLGPIPEGMVVAWIAIPLVLLACLAVSRRLGS
jgi:ubiquinol-cytochrome c reductase cytochrome c subunit